MLKSSHAPLIFSLICSSVLSITTCSAHQYPPSTPKHVSTEQWVNRDDVASFAYQVGTNHQGRRALYLYGYKDKRCLDATYVDMVSNMDECNLALKDGFSYVLHFDHDMLRLPKSVDPPEKERLVALRFNNEDCEENGREVTVRVKDVNSLDNRGSLKIGKCVVDLDDAFFAEDVVSLKQ